VREIRPARRRENRRQNGGGGGQAVPDGTYYNSSSSFLSRNSQMPHNLTAEPQLKLPKSARYRFSSTLQLNSEYLLTKFNVSNAPFLLHLGKTLILLRSPRPRIGDRRDAGDSGFQVVLILIFHQSWKHWVSLIIRFLAKNPLPK